MSDYAKHGKIFVDECLVGRRHPVAHSEMMQTIVVNSRLFESMSNLCDLVLGYFADKISCRPALRDLKREAVRLQSIMADLKVPDDSEPVRTGSDAPETRLDDMAQVDGKVVVDSEYPSNDKIVSMLNAMVIQFNTESVESAEWRSKVERRLARLEIGKPTAHEIRRGPFPLPEKR